MSGSVQPEKDDDGHDWEWGGKSERGLQKSECVKNVNWELIVFSSTRAEGIKRSNCQK